MLAQRLCPSFAEAEPIVNGKQSFDLLGAVTAPLPYFEVLVRVRDESDSAAGRQSNSGRLIRYMLCRGVTCGLILGATLMKPLSSWMLEHSSPLARYPFPVGRCSRT